MKVYQTFVGTRSATLYVEAKDRAEAQEYLDINWNKLEWREPHIEEELGETIEITEAG